MLSGLFVTGTDTNVGKTVVSAAVLHRYRHLEPLRYWKPIQTGIEQDDDTAEIRRLTGCGAERTLDRGIRLPRPVSPHLAARLSGTTIDLNALFDVLRGRPKADRWIIEGAGGVLVPVNTVDLMADLIVRFDVPALVVGRSSLGTINHTLLTLEALRSRSVRVAGVVMVGPHNPDNQSAIEEYGRVAVVGHMPVFDPLTPSALTAWAEAEFDPGGCLLGYLQ